MGKYLAKHKKSGSMMIAIIVLFCFLLSFSEASLDEVRSCDEEKTQIVTQTMNFTAAETAEKLSAETSFHAAVLRQIARKPVDCSIRIVIMAALLTLELGILVIWSACRYTRLSIFDRDVIIAYVHKKDGKK